MKKIIGLKWEKKKLWKWAFIGVALFFSVLLVHWIGGANDNAPVAMQGLNKQLPSAVLKSDKGVDKLAFYKQVDADSVRAANQRRADSGVLSGGIGTGGSSTGGGPWGSRPLTVGSVDSNVQRVNQQLAALKQTLSRAETMSGYRLGTAGHSRWDGPGSADYGPGVLDFGRGPAPTLVSTLRSRGENRFVNPEADRLENFMRVMKESSSAGNPEMRQLDTVLDKLYAVQHPGKHFKDVVSSDTAGASAALPVHTLVAGEAVTGWKQEPVKGNRFYDLESSSGEEEPMGTAIEAIIPETQTLVNGAMIRLELGTELVIKGQRIPKGTALYGIARLSNERLLVSIHSIRYRDQVYPVSLQVLDQDGLAGIYEPGSADREVVRESGADGVSSLGPSLDGAGIGAQAASAGIQLAKNLAGKKIRLVKVTVKAGYRVFLQDASINKL